MKIKRSDLLRFQQSIDFDRIPDLNILRKQEIRLRKVLEFWPDSPAI